MPMTKPDSHLNLIHHDPTGQVDLYQTDDRYYALLEKRFGSRFVEYRRRWAQASSRSQADEFPLSLDLAINSGCQLSCLMCPLQSRPEGRKVRLMDGSLFENLMRQAEEHELPALTIGLGSEPLLHPKAAEFTARAVRAGIMDIRLGTNGLLLNEAASEALIESGLTRLEISVDADSAETYRRIRGGDFNKLVQAIELFLAKRNLANTPFPLLRLSFLTLDLNRTEETGFLQRWQGLADLISIQKPIWFPGSKLPKPEQRGCSISASCAQSWQRLAVNFNGQVWPCCSWNGDKLLPHNAFTDSLKSIWQSREMTALRKALSGPARNMPPACLACEY